MPCVPCTNHLRQWHRLRVPMPPDSAGPAQGSPVMIGGGVLAYTLLGVYRNPMTEECAFLILDPHYTGPEDMNRILSGRWVAWQRSGGQAAAGGPLFVSSAHYNFLCPQRPGGV